MAEKRVRFDIEDIKINKENFRHSPLGSEEEAICYLIEEDYDSYLELAKRMEKDCRTFPVLLLKRNETYILMDGNRRTSVIKIFKHPELIPNNPRYEELRNLCRSRGPIEINELYADVYDDQSEDDRENLMNALNELHIHENKTKKDWNALSQYRASLFIGSAIKHPWIKTLEYYNYSDQDIIKMTNRKTDIFNRILRKNQLRILENGKIDLNNDTAIIQEICKIVKQKSYYIDGHVQKVDTRTDNDIYKAIIEDLIRKYSIGQPALTFNEKKELKAETEQLPKAEQRPLEIVIPNEDTPGQQHPHAVPIIKECKAISNPITPIKKMNNNRKTTISEEQFKELSKTNNMMVNQIAYELKSLPLKEFPISSAIILRSFLQYSFEWYAEKNGISIGKNNLSSNIMTVVNTSAVKNLINREEKNRIKVMINSNDVINLLNDATHNYRMPPLQSTIISDLYDALHPMIRLIFNNSTYQSK